MLEPNLSRYGLKRLRERHRGFFDVNAPFAVRVPSGALFAEKLNFVAAVVWIVLALLGAATTNASNMTPADIAASFMALTVTLARADRDGWTNTANLLVPLRGSLGSVISVAGTGREDAEAFVPRRPRERFSSGGYDLVRVATLPQFGLFDEAPLSKSPITGAYTPDGHDKDHRHRLQRRRRYDQQEQDDSAAPLLIGAAVDLAIIRLSGYGHGAAPTAARPGPLHLPALLLRLDRHPADPRALERPRERLVQAFDSADGAPELIKARAIARSSPSGTTRAYAWVQECGALIALPWCRPTETPRS